MKKISAVLLLALLLLPCTGCVENVSAQTGRKPTSYVICGEDHLPEELGQLLAEKKKKPNTFSYSNSTYSYLVVCYGEKDYGGYSIRVDACAETERALYLSTSILAPTEGEKLTETKTWPYLVVRVRKTEKVILIDS